MDLSQPLQPVPCAQPATVMWCFEGRASEKEKEEESIGGYREEEDL